MTNSTSPAVCRRRSWIALSRLAVAVSAVTGVIAAAAQLEGENLLQPPLEGLDIVNRQTEGQASLVEMRPAGETAGHWTHMATAQIYRGVVDASFYGKYKAQMHARWVQACDRADVKPFADETDHGYITHVWLQVCAYKDAQKQPEVTLFKFIQGREAAYVVQLAFHYQPDKTQLGESLRYLEQVRVCDTRAKDSPCPADASIHVVEPSPASTR